MAIISDHRDIHYLTGLLLPKEFTALVWLETADSWWMAATTDEDEVLVDEHMAYEWGEFYPLTLDRMDA